jgi:hemolysin activation/secretion protein
MKSIRNLLQCCAASSRQVLIAASCAATLVAASATYAADPPLLEVKRFVVEGANPLSEGETETLLRPHLGPHQSLNTLEAAATALQEAIRDKGYSFHRVIVPAQQPTAGVLTLRILPFILDQVTVTGNQNFTSENILRSVPGLRPGRVPNVGLLSQQVSLANEHPSKRVTLQVKESTKPDVVDADLRVADVAPSQFFLGLTGGTRDEDNTLNKNTGYTRLTLGYQHSNLFNLDHTVTVAYTTSPEYVDRVTQIGAFYTVPFYGYNTMLTGFYTHSDVDSGTVGLGGQSFDVSGSGTFYGLKATYLLPRLFDVVHNVSVGWEDRYFKSNVAFGGTPLPSSTVGSRPITFRYGGKLERDQSAFAGYVEWAYNLSGGRANNDASYAAARTGADNDFDVFRYGFDASYTLGARWTLSGKFRGQYTDEPLIPGEQLGIAGASAVRGFREREITGDRGFFINLEALGPPLVADLSPLVFYDYGMRSLLAPVINSSSREHIASAGAGLRWRWQRLDVNVTYAHVLQGAANGTDRGHDKLHFSAFYRF